MHLNPLNFIPAGVSSRVGEKVRFKSLKCYKYLLVEISFPLMTQKIYYFSAELRNCYGVG
jgi:hypothetical protein